jgi:DNA-binding LytR/AlgR family response regulator
MPHISGISLSKMLPDNVKVIFITAYSEYAVESYEIQAVDYLVKPISLERFAKSMSRVLSSKTPLIENENQFIFVKSGSETFRIASSSILYLEKDGNYMHYYCVNQKILARETIQESLEKMPDSFVQAHKSYIVNLGNITSYTSNELTIEKIKIPVSETYRSELLKRLEHSASR